MQDGSLLDRTEIKELGPITLPATGTYTIHVLSPSSGNGGGYQITVEEVTE